MRLGRQAVLIWGPSQATAGARVISKPSSLTCLASALGRLTQLGLLGHLSLSLCDSLRGLSYSVASATLRAPKVQVEIHRELGRGCNLFYD